MDHAEEAPLPGFGSEDRASPVHTSSPRAASREDRGTCRDNKDEEQAGRVSAARGPAQELRVDSAEKGSSFHASCSSWGSDHSPAEALDVESWPRDVGGTAQDGLLPALRKAACTAPAPAPAPAPKPCGEAGGCSSSPAAVAAPSLSLALTVAHAHTVTLTHAHVFTHALTSPAPTRVHARTPGGV